MINEISWSEGIQKYKSVYNSDDILSSPIFIDYKRKELIECIGTEIFFPFLYNYRFIECVDNELFLLIPFLVHRKELLINIDLLDKKCCSNIDDDIVYRDCLNKSITYLKKKYANHEIKIKYIKKIYELLSKPKTITSVDCVSIDISKGYCEWYSSLKKNMRQNIRTSYNRIRNNGGFFCFRGERGKISKRKLLKHLYLHRVRNLERRKIKVNWCYRLLAKILALVDLNNPYCTYMINNDNSFFGECYYNNDMASCVCGIISNKRLLIPYLSYNTKYAKYSPGILLINESIKYLSSKETVDVFDLYIGTEQYKLDNGGIPYSLYSITF